MARVAVTCAFTAMARSGRRPGRGGLLRGIGHGPVAILRGRPAPAGASQAPSHPDCAVIGLGPSGARFPWLPRSPGSGGPPRASPELSAWPGGSGSLGGYCPPAGSH
jgi:hypothetical protein